MNFNSWFVKGADGNMVVDPLEPDEDDLRQLGEHGGVAWVIVTNRDHERAAATFVQRFGAKVAASAADAEQLTVAVDHRLEPDEIFHGWQVIALEGFKTPGEIALYSRERSTAILGDSLWGDPAGSLRFMPDAKLTDPERAVLSMRRVRGLRTLDHVLIGDGVPIFHNGRRVLGACIDARKLTAALRINLDDVPMRYGKGPDNYKAGAGEVGMLLGAERLGYQLAHIEPGKLWCPTHWHTTEEELFIVWAGEPTLLTPYGECPLRPGDCVAFPCGPHGAHKIVNNSSAAVKILMISNQEKSDVCFYPDSKKVLVEAADLIVRSEPALEYYDGE